MAMNRVQFQQGLSLPTFQAQFGTDGQWAVAREASRWPKGFRYFYSSLLPTLRVAEKLKLLQASP